jgi:hypothetical protein
MVAGVSDKTSMPQKTARIRLVNSLLSSHQPSLVLAILYISSAVQPFSVADLAALLAQSREKNATLEITGILLYKDGDVMQLIEGPDEAVKSLAKTIYGDIRHHGVIQLLELKILERGFPDWSMEFQDLGSPKLQQLAQLLDREVSPPQPGLSPILRLLTGFGWHHNSQE